MPVKTNEEIVSAIIAGIEASMRDIAARLQGHSAEQSLSQESHLPEKE